MFWKLCLTISLVIFLKEEAEASFTSDLSSWFKDRVCTKPKDMGTVCKGSLRFLTKHYYDTVSKKCRKFIFRGCGGNSNHFETLEQCKQLCTGSGAYDKDMELSGPWRPDPRCTAIWPDQPCFMMFPAAYMYNQQNKRCEYNPFGKCSSEYFSTMEECRKGCVPGQSRIISAEEDYY